MKVTPNFFRSLPLLVAGLVLVSATADSQLLPAQSQPGGPDYVLGEVLIQFKPDVSDAHIADVFRQGQLKLHKHVQTAAMKDHGKIGLTHVSTALPVLQAVRVLNISSTTYYYRVRALNAAGMSGYSNDTAK